MSDVVKRLPLEILEKIIMNLEYLDDECSAALVNKAWCQVARRYIYASVYIDHEDAAVLYSETLCMHNPTLSSHTRSLDILSTTTKKVPRIVLQRIMASSWPNLESLTVATTAGEWLWSTTNLPVFPRLSHLQLLGSSGTSESSGGQGASFDAVARSFPCLRSLHLDKIDLSSSAGRSGDEDGEMLAFLTEACKQVQHLQYHHSQTRPHRELGRLLDHMGGSLVNLTMSGPEDTFSQHSVERIECLPSLEELDLNMFGRFALNFTPPRTLVKLRLQGAMIHTECLLTWLLEFSNPDTLPSLTSIPYLHFYSFSDRGPILQRTAGQARIAWDSLRARKRISAPSVPDPSYGASWHLYDYYTPG